ncbi:MAG: hypothetical protein OEM59_03425 [Rhodospirillales bacterium]|nr:hypothetical protein [Rhodospirillales bacterium]
MDEDLARIIRKAMAAAEAAGLDHSGQTDHAVEKVLALRSDMTTSSALNAVNLVRTFLAET